MTSASFTPDGACLTPDPLLPQVAFTELPGGSRAPLRTRIEAQ